jgi:hypothetical protein
MPHAVTSLTNSTTSRAARRCGPLQRRRAWLHDGCRGRPGTAPCVMRTLSMVAVVLCLANAVTTFTQSATATDYPYGGTWRLNMERSDFAETTVTYALSPQGQIRVTTSGQSYIAQLDGKDYPALFGGTAAWKAIDAATWETAFKQNAKLISTATTRLSRDGRSLSVNLKGPKPSGGTFDSTRIYERASGGPGLSGAWKTKSRPVGTPDVVELVPAGPDGLTITFPGDREHCAAKFDGADYPMVGPIAQPGLTLALRRISARSFEVTGKQDGKPLFVFTYTVSNDGRTLTQTGGMVGTKEQFSAVYDRQSRTPAGRRDPPFQR